MDKGIFQEGFLSLPKFEHFCLFLWEDQHHVLLREMMFSWNREALFNLPPSLGGKCPKR